MPPVRLPHTNTAPRVTAALPVKVELAMPPSRPPPTDTAPPEPLVAWLPVKVELAMPPVRSPPTTSAPPPVAAAKPLKVSPVPQLMVASPEALRKRLPPALEAMVKAPPVELTRVRVAPLVRVNWLVRERSRSRLPGVPRRNVI